MTSMGEKMSDQEVEDMIKEAAPNSEGKVKYEGSIVHCIIINFTLAIKFIS